MSKLITDLTSDLFTIASGSTVAPPPNYGNDFVMEFLIEEGDKQLTIPCANVGIFEAVIDWGDGTTSEITAYDDADLAHTYEEAGTYIVRISGSFPTIRFNNGGDRLKLRRVVQLGDVGWLSFAQAFYGCENLVSFKAAPCNTVNVTSAASMLRNLLNMTATPNLTGLSLPACTTFASMMNEWPLVTMPPDLSSLNPVSATTCTTMMTNWSSMLYPPNLKNFTTPECTSMSYMMDGWSSMLAPPDLSDFDTSKVQNFTAMCRNWSSMGEVGLIGIENFNVSSGTAFNNFANGTKFSTPAYDAILNSWSDQIGSSLTFHFGTSRYSEDAAAARAYMVETKSATITDGGEAGNLLYHLNITESDIGADYSTLNPGKLVGYVNPVYGRVLRATYDPTSIGSPRLTFLRSFTPVNEATIYYKVYFEPGFDFKRGGKLPGLGPSNPLTGCGDGTASRWSVRLMWLQDQKLGVYYYGQVRGTSCGDTLVAHGVTLTDDHWYQVKIRVKLNDPGVENGIVQLWLDDVLVRDDDDLLLLGEGATSSGQIQRFVFNTFFGGSDPSWAPSKTVYAQFRDMEVYEGSGEEV